MRFAVCKPVTDSEAPHDKGPLTMTNKSNQPSQPEFTMADPGDARQIKIVDRTGKVLHTVMIDRRHCKMNTTENPAPGEYRAGDKLIQRLFAQRSN